MGIETVKGFLCCQDEHQYWNKKKKTGIGTLGQSFNQTWVSNGWPLPWTAGGAGAGGQADVVDEVPADGEGELEIPGDVDADAGGDGDGGLDVEGEPGAPGDVDVDAGGAGDGGCDVEGGPGVPGDVDADAGGAGDAGDENHARQVPGIEPESKMWPLSVPDLGIASGFGQHEFTLVKLSSNKKKVFHCACCNKDLAPSGVAPHFKGEAHGVPNEVVGTWNCCRDYNKQKDAKVGHLWKKASKAMKASAAPPQANAAPAASQAVPKQPTIGGPGTPQSYLKPKAKAKPSAKALPPPPPQQVQQQAGSPSDPVLDDWIGKQSGFGYKELDTFHYSGTPGVLICQVCAAKGGKAKEVKIRTVYTHLISHQINIKASCKNWKSMEDYNTYRSEGQDGISFQGCWHKHVEAEIIWDQDVDVEVDVDVDGQVLPENVGNDPHGASYGGPIWVSFGVDEFVVGWTNAEFWDDSRETHPWPHQLKTKAKEQNIIFTGYRYFLKGTKQNSDGTADGHVAGMGMFFSCLTMDPPGPHNHLDLVRSLNKQPHVLDQLASYQIFSVAKWWTGKMLNSLKIFGEHLFRECNNEIYTHTDYFQNVQGMMHWVTDVKAKHKIQIKALSHQKNRRDEFKLSKYAPAQDHRTAVRETFLNFQAFSWAVRNPDIVESLGLDGPDWLHACEVECYGGITATTFAGRPGPWQDPTRATIMRPLDVGDDKIVFTKHKNGAAIGDIGIWIPPGTKELIKDFDSLMPPKRPFYWNKVKMDAQKNTHKWCIIHYKVGCTIRTASLDRKKMETDSGDMSELNPSEALIVAQKLISKSSASIGHHGKGVAKDIYDTKKTRHLSWECKLMWEAHYGDPIDWPCGIDQESPDQKADRLRVNHTRYRAPRNVGDKPEGSGVGGGPAMGQADVGDEEPADVGGEPGAQEDGDVHVHGGFPVDVDADADAPAIDAPAMSQADVEDEAPADVEGEPGAQGDGDVHVHVGVPVGVDADLDAGDGNATPVPGDVHAVVDAGDGNATPVPGDGHADVDARDGNETAEAKDTHMRDGNEAPHEEEQEGHLSDDLEMLILNEDNVEAPGEEMQQARCKVNLRPFSFSQSVQGSPPPVVESPYKKLKFKRTMEELLLEDHDRRHPGST